MTPFCDLHAHSHFSDGTLSPSELVSLAQKTGLGAVALTDHNTVAGLEEFFYAAKQVPDLEAVLGIEFSVDYKEQELHLLALFLNPQDFPAIEKLLREALERKEKSNLLLIENLKTAGISLDYAAIKASNPSGIVNRAVIAAHMVKAGYCESVKEAFHRYLHPQRGYFIPPKRLCVFETLEFIRSLGAVSVLAHPFLNLTESELREFLPRAKAHGLCGMEVFYSKFSPEQTQLAAELCEEFSLLPSGGSDFHGDNKPDISLGAGRGNLAVPISVYHNLKVCAKPK